MDAFQFDARESGGIVEFFAKGNVRITALTDADLVVDGDTDPGYSFTRASDTDLPGAVRISFADPVPRPMHSAGVEARKAIGNSQNVAQVVDRGGARRRLRAGCRGHGAAAGLGGARHRRDQACRRRGWRSTPAMP